ncbi:hypothetical protein B0T25DRAFT_555025 [Lasiosphaeria hispida]|uniref:DUF3984 domain-containing protein n=1 Tax=Lasiosphaeria hispida TaxID=260671 RepID=A0AAJ0M977_9PEZI|nr:hypothetical protein B0T25DRAFT_555025 [Lasiosphaeria hispida]
MDVAYNQHANAARRKNRSSTNLNHLTLAPLTSKLPLQDNDDLADPYAAPPSYLQGKSAPTTPRLLSRSPGRSPHHSRAGSTSRLPKSKSATHLDPSVTPFTSRSHGNNRHSITTTSSTVKRRRDDPFAGTARSDSDWLLRAGALISTETRESKGQAWLVSRVSSTSLAGLRDPDDDAFDRELAHERELHLRTSAAGSRRRSRDGNNGYFDDAGDHVSSPPYSRLGSRSHSRVGSRSQMMTPLDQRPVDGYFPATAGAGADGDDTSIAGPDFVNLDETLETVDELDSTAEDDAMVRRLVKKGNGGVGTWFGSVLGVQLFPVDEDEEESDDSETTEGDTDEAGFQPHQRRVSSARRLEGLTSAKEDFIPPPKTNEGGWHDAAWLLTVASKVLL